MEFINAVVEVFGYFIIVYLLFKDLIIKLAENIGNDRIIKLESEVNKELEHIKSDLEEGRNKKNIVINDLNNTQRAVISIFMKMYSGYFSKDDLANIPDNMPGKYKAKYSRVAGEDVSKKIIHAAYQYDHEIGTYMMKAQNPVIAFNLLMLETATNEKMVQILTFHMEYTYKGFEKLNIDNAQIYLSSLIYKYLIMDYKNLEIEDDVYIKFTINDYDETIGRKSLDDLKGLIFAEK